MINEIVITRDAKKFSKDKKGILKYEENGRLRIWVNNSRVFYDSVPIILERPDVKVLEWKSEDETPIVVDLSPSTFLDLEEGGSVYFKPCKQDTHFYIPSRLREKAENLLLDDLIERTNNDEIEWETWSNGYSGSIGEKNICEIHIPDLVVFEPIATIYYENEVVHRSIKDEKIGGLLQLLCDKGKAKI